MIILTGASGGIGRAILGSLAKLDQVVALYRTQAPDTGGDARIECTRVDLSSESDVAAFCAGVGKSHDRLTLIHAAALSRDGLAAQLSTGDWDEVMDVNLRGNFLLTRGLLKPMVARKWGRIVHFSSVAALRGVPGTVAYSAAKSGLVGMSRVLAAEYGRFGITSNVLALGYFDTGLIETLSDKVRERVIEQIPSRKLGSTGDIVTVIDCIMRSDYISGSVITIDGGIAS